MLQTLLHFTYGSSNTQPACVVRCSPGSRGACGRHTREWGHSLCNARLSAGADVNADDVEGSTPLCTAAFNGHRGVCDTLIAAGAKVGTTRQDRGTPLHSAAQRDIVMCAMVSAGVMSTQSTRKACHLSLLPSRAASEMCVPLFRQRAPTQRQGMCKEPLRSVFPLSATVPKNCALSLQPEPTWKLQARMAPRPQRSGLSEGV